MTNPTRHLDAATYQSLISDLFFNYQNENYSRLDWPKSPSGEQIVEAIQKDAKVFADHYFDLLATTSEIGWADRAAFANWLHLDFMNRL